ncbi:MAG TPA: rhodanese-like domain-containing protein [Rubrivivax sp.]|nr:rhodanese-like domain-containing protein [Rubrivivax sp.]
MKSLWNTLTACVFVALTLPFAQGAQAGPGPLVDPAWLQRALAAGEVLVLDAQPSRLHAAGHIPGAVPVDVFAWAMDEGDAQAMQRHIRSWGVSPDRTVLITDQGASFLAPRVYYELLYRGHPPERLHVLDGGMAKWRAAGGAVTQDKTAPPAAGSFTLGTRPEVRADLPEVLVATGDTQRHAVVDALGPEMYFGAMKLFDRAGHLPHAVSWPSEEFFNADKTFKSADEVRALAANLGLRPDQQVYTYCGGGIAAAVPFFALRQIAGYPQVKLYVGSQLEWVRDSRDLPLWTFGAPHLARNASWLAGWTNPMLRAFGVTQLNIVDVRSAEAFAGGHIPASRNVPATAFSQALKQPAALRPRLEAEGVRPDYETVIVSERGLDKASALAFLALQSLDMPRVSVLVTGTDEWALRGLPWTKPATAAASAVPSSIAAGSRAVTTTLAEAAGPVPRVYIASGAALPAEPPPGKVIHLPATQLVTDDGSVKAAAELWTAISKAGVPRHAQLVFVADDVGEAAMNFYVFRLMGYTNLRVLLR